MRFHGYLLFSACLVLTAGNSALGQGSHFLYKANTGNNAKVGISASIKPTICGDTIAAGDEIGVFTPRGLCVGAGVWTGANMTITVWGDDDGTPEIDGIRPGEQLQFRVHRKFGNMDYIAKVRDSLGISTYIKNWIYHLRSLVGTSQLSVKLKVFLEGPFSHGAMTTALNTSGMIPLNSSVAYNTTRYGYTAKTISTIPNSDVVDWVLVELRVGTSAWTRVETQAAFLLKDGSVVDIDGTSDVVFTFAPAGNYYIVMRHRNHLAIMSAAIVPLPNSSIYDFTKAVTQAYGTAPMKDLIGSGGPYGMYAGDANGDGIINAVDRNIYLMPSIGTTGYKNADFNLNGGINAVDVNNYWRPNNGLISNVP